MTPPNTLPDQPCRGRRAHGGITARSRTRRALWAALVLALGTHALGAGGSEPSATPREFTTKLGTFTAGDWSEVNGWTDEQHGEALAVFNASCRTLGKRPAWRDPCEAARVAARGGDAAARAFFESEFVPYRVSGRETDDDGLLTGYFEPAIPGSRERGDRFVHPVYGVPDDMLYLDLRRVSRGLAGLPGFATIEGRDVVPVVNETAARATGTLLFKLEVAGAGEPLDRRLRVRIEGDRIVPYRTRQQIDEAQAWRGPVIAWVDDPNALYVMQVQGSGRIRLPDGQSIRLSYADQNGHPFTPRGAARAPAVRTRGAAPAPAEEPAPPAQLSATLLSMIDVDDPGTSVAQADEPVVRTRSISVRPSQPVREPAPPVTTSRREPAPTTSAPRASGREQDEDVDRVIRLLLGQTGAGGRPASGSTASAPRPPAPTTTPTTTPTTPPKTAPLTATPPQMPAAPPAPTAATSAPPSTTAPAPAAVAPVPTTPAPTASTAPSPAATARARASTPPPQAARAERSAAAPPAPAASDEPSPASLQAYLARMAGARQNDRSYVFFKESDNTAPGPTGALGIPLAAERSAAVDPRSTPLGAPLFIESRSDRSDVIRRRLMFAHDTGGAIRGAVRADFFWGSGPRAGARALSTRETLAMWVLLPKGFDTSGRLGGRTRSLGGAAPDCVMDDPEFC
jgi:membrane-bound lytic murein transglycosylase A